MYSENKDNGNYLFKYQEKKSEKKLTIWIKLYSI